jgi:hypothetical protein
MLERRKKADRCSAVTVTVVVGGYRLPLKSLMAIIRLANSTKL